MKKISLFIACSLSLVVMSQSLYTDVKVPKGSLSFKPVTHGSLVMEINGTVICVDPYGGAHLYGDLASIDYIVITDIHQDHYSAETLEGLDLRASKFIVPGAVYDLMPADWQKNAVVVKNGEHTRIGEVDIEAIPMYNLSEDRKNFHVKGRGNGYVFDLGGFRLYISGDTEDTPEMRALENIDMAFVCMNLPYTMSVEQAAAAVSEFMPVVVYPYHYRNGDKSLSDVRKFAELVREEGVEAVLLDWY